MTTADLLTLIHAANCTDAGHHEACDAVRNLQATREIARKFAAGLEADGHVMHTALTDIVRHDSTSQQVRSIANSALVKVTP